MLKHFETCFLESNLDLCVALLGRLCPKDSAFPRVDWCSASEQCNQMLKMLGEHLDDLINPMFLVILFPFFGSFGGSVWDTA